MLKREGLTVNVRARTVSFDWKPILLTICKTIITAEQVNTNKNCCTLTADQMGEVSKSISELIVTKEIRPYCEFFISTGSGKTTLISNKLDNISILENAENARRWGLSTGK